MQAGGAIDTKDRRHKRGGWWLLGRARPPGPAVQRVLAIGRQVFPPFTWLVIAITAWMFLADALWGARIVRPSETDPVRVLSRRLADRSAVFPIFGTDTSGRTAAFDVVVFDRHYTWVRGATDALALNSVPISRANLRQGVLDGPVREVLAAGLGAIAVGVASQEGATAVETERARDRAVQAARWLREVAGLTVPLYTLNLGKFLGSDDRFDEAATSWQRPFIVIAIRTADRGVRLQEALADAMRDKSNLASAEAYSSFELRPVAN